MSSDRGTVQWYGSHVTSRHASSSFRSSVGVLLNLSTEKSSHALFWSEADHERLGARTLRTRMKDLTSLASLAELMTNRGIFQVAPDQVLINEYHPGQGIADHVDRIDHSGEIVVSLSLLSEVVMDFKPLAGTPGDPVQRILPRHSLLVLAGEARHRWTHGIAKRLNDKINGRTVPRHRRISITFRDRK